MRENTDGALYAPLPESAFGVAESAPWLVSWCPPCRGSRDAFGILAGLYRPGGAWVEGLAGEHGLLARHCPGATAACERHSEHH